MSNASGHHWIRDKKRRAIHARDGWRCVWCFCDLAADGAPRTLDHVVPRASGGTHEARNLVTACWACNHRRGDLSLLVWLGVCAKRIYVVDRVMRDAVAADILDRVLRWTARPLIGYREIRRKTKTEQTA